VGKSKLDAVIDCVGAIETIQTGFGLLATSGAFVSVGLVRNKIDISLFPFVAGELGIPLTNHNQLTNRQLN